MKKKSMRKGISQSIHLYRRKSSLISQRRKSFLTVPINNENITTEKVSNMYSEIIKMSMENVFFIFIYYSNRKLIKKIHGICI